ncbi:CDC45-like protein [Ascobolus immersus RN42]|uniref:CDC45-like protein n=1 Tax=Ascobolus immersus RN42 TaxID=1160509 RepID=A0A3N4HSG8_ASCIM|nr:CDC45-like protein [Ascobolus immersus RN42]
MFIPRTSLAAAHAHLLRHATPASPSILVLAAPTPDALCASRILTHILKHDFLPHLILPVAGYRDLEVINQKQIKGNETLRFVICIGLGGLFDIAEFLGWDEEDPAGQERPEVWVIDARRPWNLGNVFGGGGRVEGGQDGLGGFGGVKCWDDGDIEVELGREGEAYKALEGMPEVSDEEESDEDDDLEDEEEEVVDLLGEESKGRKRKSSEDEEEDAGRSRRRRLEGEEHETSPEPLPRRGLLSTSSGRYPSSPPLDTHPSSPTPSLPPPMPSQRTLRRKLRRLRHKHQATIAHYYSTGTSYSSPASSLLYSLASDLSREDPDLLWLALVGCSSTELYGHQPPPTIERSTFNILRDEVRRLNPPPPGAAGTSTTTSIDTPRGPDDRSIRISPEFRFLLIRHWSLYDSMLHSPHLIPRLNLFSPSGIKRLHKLLAKMGISLTQCRQSYTHMDMQLKRTLREKVEGVGRLYGLEGVVREGYVRSWGWKAVLSAGDVGAILGALLEGGGTLPEVEEAGSVEREDDEQQRNWNRASDALENIDLLLAAIPGTLTLARATMRVATGLIQKGQIKTLNSFRFAVVRDGPDLGYFLNPGALQRLAMWLGEAIYEEERQGGRRRHLPLVLAVLNGARGVFLCEEEEEEEIVLEEGRAKNRFGIAFQEVAASTNARVRVDSFEASVIEVRQEDLIGFFEELSRRVVLGG